MKEQGAAPTGWYWREVPPSCVLTLAKGVVLTGAEGVVIAATTRSPARAPLHTPREVPRLFPGPTIPEGWRRQRAALPQGCGTTRKAMARGSHLCPGSGSCAVPPAMPRTGPQSDSGEGLDVPKATRINKQSRRLTTRPRVTAFAP